MQEVLAYAAHQLRLVYRTLRESTAAIGEAIATPWHITRIAPFTKTMHWCIANAPIPIEVVAVGPKEPPPDVVLERNVGYIMANRHVDDRVALLLLLLYSKQCHLVRTWCTSSPAERRTAGIPDQITRILRRIETAHRTPPPPAPYDGGHRERSP